MHTHEVKTGIQACQVYFACRAARLCHAVAHGGQIAVPLDIAQRFVEHCTGTPAPFTEQSLLEGSQQQQQQQHAGHAASQQPAEASDSQAMRNSTQASSSCPAGSPNEPSSVSAPPRRSRFSRVTMEQIVRGASLQGIARKGSLVQGEASAEAWHACMASLQQAVTAMSHVHTYKAVPGQMCSVQPWSSKDLVCSSDHVLQHLYTSTILMGADDSFRAALASYRPSLTYAQARSSCWHTRICTDRGVYDPEA